MKKYFFLIFIFISTFSYADWQFLVGSGAGFDFYVDRATTIRTGNKVKIWIMQNWEVTQEFITLEEYNSMVALYTYDCKEKNLQIGSINFYEKKFGKGKVIAPSASQVNQQEKMEIIPNSIGYEVWKIACGKK